MNFEKWLNKCNNITLYKDVKLNKIGDLLKTYIKEKNNFFEITNIVFPNDNLIQWFKTYWLKTEDAVLMNVNFLTIDECLINLLDIEKKYSLVKRKEIRALIIKQIILFEKEHLDSKVKSYIYDGETINSIRLFDLANNISKLFIDYEKSAFDFSNWQKDLYNFVMEELDKNSVSSFSYIYNKIKKFKEENSPIIFFGFNDLDELYLNPISLLSKSNKLIFYLLTSSTEEHIDINLLAAPSKTREIEAVHSKICSLIKNNRIKYSDILVLCPDISKYEIEISKVFNQDGVSFPNIPFNINDKKTRETNVTIILKKLFKLSVKKFFTRLDFSEIINNKLIMEVRNISKDDIDNWQQSIIEMNVFRNGKRVDDWKYAKKRLILSKVASINSLDDNIVELHDGEYIPFSNINFDDDSIIKFVKIIDDINEWIEFFANEKFVSKENIELLKNQLIKWFSLNQNDGVEGNKVLLKLITELNFWSKYGLTNNTIPMNTLFYTLFEISEETKINSSSLFVDGVTFIDYDENSILSSKIIFFIGASSKDFPVLETRSEIDLRPNISTDKFENFQLQCANATEKLFLSYINKNLKTDEEYFPSTYLIKLFEKNKYEVKNEDVIGIDETRSWDELFTKREYKEKNYYTGLFNNKEFELDETSRIVPEIMKKVSVSQMKNYLMEPLKYKFEHLFGRVDETNDLINDQYEPLNLDSLTNYILNKSTLLYLLKHNECKIINDDNHVDICLAKKIFKRFIIEHKIPNINEEIEDINIENAVLNSLVTKNGIVEITNGDYKITKIKDFQFKYNDEDIVLIYNDELCYSLIDNTRVYFELCRSQNSAKNSLFLTIYVCSLMDVASLNTDYEYSIKLYKGAGCFTSYSITPEKAKEVLIEIYRNMNSYEINAYMPINFLQKKKKPFEAMIEDAMGPNGEWKFFKDKKLFNPQKDLGYNRFNYEEKSTVMKNQLEELVLYIKKNEEK